MSYDPRQVAFIDTETTGLDPERHRIWEIAVIINDDEHVWQQRIGGFEGLWAESPSIDPWVLENTGIRERYDHGSAVNWLESQSTFARLTRGRHLVGACPWFDSERMHRLWLAAHNEGRQHPWHYHLIDVETLMVGYLQGSERGYDADGSRIDDVHHMLPWDSRELSRLVGVDPDDFGPAHSALADARWAKACFEAVIGKPA